MKFKITDKLSNYSVKPLIQQQLKIDLPKGEIQYHKYYQYLYKTLFPLPPLGSQAFTQPDDMMLLKGLIDFALKDQQGFTPQDKEIATQLNLLLKDYSAAKTGEHTLEKIALRYTQAINSFNFKDCKQMVILLVAYYSFFPDKLPKIFSTQREFLAQLTSWAWLRDVFHFLPNTAGQDAFRAFWHDTDLRRYEFVHKPPPRMPFQGKEVTASHWLKFRLPARSKLNDHLIQKFLVTKIPYKTNNWVIFFATAAFFEFLPIATRKQIMGAVLDQFKIFLTLKPAKTPHYQQTKIIYFDVINKIYPHVDSTQQPFIDNQNEQLAIEIYQLLLKDQNNSIMGELNVSIRNEAKFPILFILSRVAKNMHQFSAQNQEYLSTQLMSFLEKFLSSKPFLDGSVSVNGLGAKVIAVILNLKSQEQKQAIMQRLFEALRWSNSPQSGLFHILQETIHCFSQEFQRTILDFLYGAFLKNDFKYCADFLIYPIQNVTPDNVAYMAKNLLAPADHLVSSPAEHTLFAAQQEDMVRVLSSIYDLFPETIQHSGVNHCLNWAIGMFNALRLRRGLELLRDSSKTMCQVLLNLIPVVSREVRNQLTTMAIDIFNMTKNDYYVVDWSTRLLIQAYQRGNETQRNTIFAVIEPLYSSENRYFAVMVLNQLLLLFTGLSDPHRDQLLTTTMATYSRLQNDKTLYDGALLIHYLLTKALSYDYAKAKFVLDSRIHTGVINLYESIPTYKLALFVEKLLQLLVSVVKTEKILASDVLKTYLTNLPKFIKRLKPEEQIAILRKLTAMCMTAPNAYNLCQVFKPVFDAVYEDKTALTAKVQYQSFCYAVIAESLFKSIPISGLSDLVLAYAGAPEKPTGAKVELLPDDEKDDITTPTEAAKKPAADVKVKIVPLLPPRERIKPKADYFNLCITMNFNERKQAAKSLADGMITPIIQYAAQGLLADLGITNVYSFVIGPDYASDTGVYEPGKGWNAAVQLKRYIEAPAFEQAKYVFCPFATLTGRHSVTVFIHKEQKKIYCIDSLGVGGPGQEDAVAKLTSAKNEIPELKGFSIVTPQKMDPPQQTEPNDPNCGLYTIRTIIGLVLMLENKEVAMHPFKMETILPTINLLTGEGLGPILSKELIDIWRVVVQLVYDAAPRPEALQSAAAAF